ncbi:hypothetical protein CHS0354_032510 [Potamilus streckersoni]|uniref:Galectin n=1 Tax=Potamilus streckersoni TaxID=2493646 RepID=A0AAE0W0P1_9BIVA|nr:hypothetical protein CHS0354_032510 [Potamilus streckersoni]
MASETSGGSLSQHLEIPFVRSVSLNENSKIIIKGRPLEGASRFNIWFQIGADPEPDNVAFAYDARFNYGSDKNVVVCSHRMGEGSCSEERNTYHFPFVQGHRFKIMILVNLDHYQIQVGSHVTKFYHRFAIQDVDTLRIDGNIELIDVKVMS